MGKELATEKPMDHTAEVIRHLSSEITTQSNYLMNFRTRLAFTVLLGPFIAIGAALVALKTPPTLRNMHGKLDSAASVVAVVSYFLLALYGAGLDNHVTKQCDKWRRDIAALLRNQGLEPEDLTFPHSALRAYVAGFGLVILAFVSMIFLLTQLFAP